jgi:hypothetical protein
MTLASTVTDVTVVTVHITTTVTRLTSLYSKLLKNSPEIFRKIRSVRNANGSCKVAVGRWGGQGSGAVTPSGRVQEAAKCIF